MSGRGAGRRDDPADLHGRGQGAERHHVVPAEQRRQGAGGVVRPRRLAVPVHRPRLPVLRPLRVGRAGHAHRPHLPAAHGRGAVGLLRRRAQRRPALPVSQGRHDR